MAAPSNGDAAKAMNVVPQWSKPDPLQTTTKNILLLKLADTELQPATKACDHSTYLLLPAHLVLSP
jgi:hypothetical protein